MSGNIKMVNGNISPAANMERPTDYYGVEARRLLERLKLQQLQPVPRGQEYMVLIPFMHSLLDHVETLQSRLLELELKVQATHNHKGRKKDGGG